MPKIYDNINNRLTQGLSDVLKSSFRADFCVGYFNLRGWREIADQIDQLKGGDIQEKSEQNHYVCRLLVGMQKLPIDILQEYFNHNDDIKLSTPKALALKKKIAEEFKEQLTVGSPSAVDEKTLRHLCTQLKEGKLKVRLHLNYPLHAKLYLAHRGDNMTPKIAFLGSSNLTLAGLVHQGELNIDVMDQDAAEKLSIWFDERWTAKYCLDISQELIQIIDDSWAAERLVQPYHIYLKIAYHLSQEAREGLESFSIPSIFTKVLLPFQREAVLIAAKKLNKRGVVMIGDVVGLGKTITACAIARIFEEDKYYSTLVICPPKLKKMWEQYRDEYDLKMTVLSLGQTTAQLSELKRFPLVIIDESHNLRGSDGNRYKSIKEYVALNENKVILLTATPYNKSYTDLSNQLRLVVSDERDLGISPEHYIRSLGGAQEFTSKHTETFIRSIKAFERSNYSDDWRDLMRLFLVRRTRSFIKKEYAKYDQIKQRYYLTFPDGSRSYFPNRVPKKVEYAFDATNPNDQYARLYAQEVVDKINALNLPRYGLGLYIVDNGSVVATPEEQQILDNLTKSGKRLKGFTRTNLFKRLESSGFSFLLSLARHALRNYVFYYALSQNLPIPIGKNFIESLDDFLIDEEEDGDKDETTLSIILDPDTYLAKAQDVYNMHNAAAHKFHWLGAHLFNADLGKHLLKDADFIISILRMGNNWNPKEDKQLLALHKLISQTHSNQKILVFTQYLDTAEYLERELTNLGISNLAAATGQSKHIGTLTNRFSPNSNRLAHLIKPHQELRVLIATDVLSEGQNLQDAHIIINYDLPWAIIRLIQRAGRVDRIGQQSDNILCYSFLPEKGLEDIIKLRSRLSQRIKENAEVVGTDEIFFEGDPINLQDLYNEKSDILEEEEDSEVDLSSMALQIWNNATQNNPELRKQIEKMPNVLHASKENQAEPSRSGVIVYTRITDEDDMMAWVNHKGQIVSQSQYTILKAVECQPQTPALPRAEEHYELVEKGVQHIYAEIKNTEDSIRQSPMGKRTSVKHRLYARLDNYIQKHQQSLFDNRIPDNRMPDIKLAANDVYKCQLRESTREILARQFKLGISDSQLIDLVLSLRDSDKLVIQRDILDDKKPQIICSMGLI
jgi:superfamily II DNA or RNA helicase